MRATILFLNLIFLAATAATSHATEQIPDEVIYERKTYDLIGVTGELPTPETFGMETRATLSSNWRGFYTKYEIRLNKLEIYQITINAKDNEYRNINGIRPDFETDKECYGTGEDRFCTRYGALYNEVEYPVNLNGKLRLGHRLLPWFRVHMGFQKPSAYKEVIELEFVNGEIVDVIDRSEEVEIIRGEFKDYYDNSMNEEAIVEAFSLSMEELK